MKTDDIVAFVASHVELLKNLPADQIKRLVEGSQIITFEPNEAIIEFGQVQRFVGVIIDGEAEISMTDDAGSRHRVSLLGTGELFGELALMTGDRTLADVIGVSRCKALIISQELFMSVVATHPGALMHLSRRIAERANKIGEVNRSRAASIMMQGEDPYGFTLKSDTPHKILVINCGSSSLKFSMFDTEDASAVVDGIVENIGSARMRLACTNCGTQSQRALPSGGHREAFAAVVEELTAQKAIRSPGNITAVGHRVVHGGEKFTSAVVITDEVVRDIESLSHLAPLHNPVNVIGIQEARSVFPHAIHVAVFDTTFHHTLPPYAYLYGLPYEYYEKKGIRRYGFHGTSHLYVALKAAQFLKRPFNELEIITCHLGNGASMCAVDHGRSVDTTMGLTPTAGILMGTRCGDVDPGVFPFLMRSEGLDADAIDSLINKESGLKGLSGLSHDMRQLEEAAGRGDHRALLALKTFCYQIRKYIGAYVAAMQGLDAVVFTGGIGENSPGVRSLACQRLSCMGIVLDEEKNRAVSHSPDSIDIAAADSPIRILVVATDEERMIARESLRAIERASVDKILTSRKPLPIPIEVSAHHVHLCQEHVEALFGAGHHLTPESELSQTGQYASKEKVTLVGPKGRVERVRVLGPARKETQVEIAMTEQFKLGIHPPIRESGDIDGTPGATIEGPAGAVALEKGVICALRHIHMSPQDALTLGLRDRYVVRVRVEGDRELIFGDVLVRVHPSFKLAMHLDTDEANAANLQTGAIGYIEGIQSRD